MAPIKNILNIVKIWQFFFVCVTLFVIILTSRKPLFSKPSKNFLVHTKLYSNNHAYFWKSRLYKGEFLLSLNFIFFHILLYFLLIISSFFRPFSIPPTPFLPHFLFSFCPFFNPIFFQILKILIFPPSLVTVDNIYIYPRKDLQQKYRARW